MPYSKSVVQNNSKHLMQNQLVSVDLFIASYLYWTEQLVILTHGHAHGTKGREYQKMMQHFGLSVHCSLRI